MLHLDVSDGKLNDGQRVDVGGDDDVGDVAVDEGVAWLETENGGFGDAGVGATDPDCRERVSTSDAV